MYVYIYIYIYIHMYTCDIYIYIYIYIHTHTIVFSRVAARGSCAASGSPPGATPRGENII